MNEKLLVSPTALSDRLFQHAEGRVHAHKRFFRDMMVGILGSRSPIVANVARFLNESIELKQTEKRLCRMLRSSDLDWEGLRMRTLEINSYLVKENDVIAFDPGDLGKSYARKMEKIYRVHDGSTGDCGWGFEDFSAEAIQWVGGRKFHIPLYQKVIAASCEDYISQNRQICDAIHAIYRQLRGRGIWTFDRGHDRSRIFEKALLLLDMRWILRAKENRSVIPMNRDFLEPGQERLGLIDLARKLSLSRQPIQLLHPKKTAPVYAGWERIQLEIDAKKRWWTVVVVYDRRNIDPIILLTNLTVNSAEDAILVFGYYLERWGKEEGYRFLKSYLHSEDVRTISWPATQNLSFLSFLAYSFITWFYRSAPEQVEKLIDSRLKHFVPVDDIKFKYYRVAQLMQLLLCEQFKNSHLLATMTQVG